MSVWYNYWVSEIDKQKLKERMNLKIRKSFELEGIYFTDEEFEKIQIRSSES